MAHCGSCGRPLTPGIAFCTACGATLAEGAPAAAPMPVDPRESTRSVVGESLQLATKNFGAFLATQGVFVILGSLAAFWIGRIYLRPTMGPLLELGRATEPDLGAMLAAMAPMLGWSAASALASIAFGIVGGAFGLATSDLLRAGERATPRAVWAKVSPHLGGYLATAFLVGLAVAGVLLGGLALFFLILPLVAAIVFAIILYLRWSLAPAASLLDGHDARASLARSTAITRGARGPILSALFLAISISVLPGMIIGSIGAPPVDPAVGYVEEPLWVEALRWAGALVFRLGSAFFLSSALAGFYRALAPRAA